MRDASSHDLRLVEDARRRRLSLPPLDTTLIAWSGSTPIWHTEKTATYDCPEHFAPDGQLLYRGFRSGQLQRVLETGLDVPPHAPFFAVDDDVKAWEYPGDRKLAARLVLDASCVIPSYIQRPADASESWSPDTANYPREYSTDTGARVWSRFAGTPPLPVPDDEIMYGHWVPGDARAALLEVVLGGPLPQVAAVLAGLNLNAAHRITFTY